MIQERYIQRIIGENLKEKMVFLGGPRQVGKTTLAKQIAKQEYPRSLYLNWDYREDRAQMLSGKIPGDTPLVIFDEFHKYRLWKTRVKGLFDKYHDRLHILVTGSARLDVYRKGGDSMMGRYYYYRLHPFSVAEIQEKNNKFKVGEKLQIPEESTKNQDVLGRLLEFGGFPESFLSKDLVSKRRFDLQRLDRLISEDIR